MYLVVAAAPDEAPDQQRSLYLLKKESEDQPLPTLLNPISQSVSTADINSVGKSGLSDFGLRQVLGEAVSSPNTLMVNEDSFATLVMGFPELEFSPSEVYSWPKDEESLKMAKQVVPNNNTIFAGRKYHDSGKNLKFLKESCQIVRPVGPTSIPAKYAQNNHGLAAPGNVAAFLEVVDLMSQR
jgi:hypothetical protein